MIIGKLDADGWKIEEVEMDEIKINEKFYSISDSWNAVIAECEFLRKRYKKILENEKEEL